MKRGGEMRESGTTIGNDKDGEWRLETGDWRLRNNGNRAALNRVRYKLRAIHVDAGIRDEKRARNDLARVGSDASNLETGGWRLEIGDSNSAHELFELHRAQV